MNNKLLYLVFFFIIAISAMELDVPFLKNVQSKSEPERQYLLRLKQLYLQHFSNTYNIHFFAISGIKANVRTTC